MVIKESLYQFCYEFANGRVLRIQNNIKNIQESLSSETKSSAGDKHETGRAMLQLEREKLGQQLAESEKMLQVLSKTKTRSESTSNIVGLGSLVKTTMSDYFLSISAGEFKDGGQLVYCISAVTPIGRLLLGKSIGDTAVFNGKSITILEII